MSNLLHLGKPFIADWFGPNPGFELKFKKIVILGLSGAGKTNFARALSERTNIPHLELDAFYWQSGWQAMAESAFRQTIAKELEAQAWIVEGHFGRVHDIVVPMADAILWLDPPFYVVFWRLLRRSLNRSFSREPLWAGNRETFRRLVGRESALLWLFKMRRRSSEKFARAFSDPQFANKVRIRARSAREAAKALRALG